MSDEQSNNPMHGVTLENVVVKLVEHYGWDGLARRIRINCFKNNPSVKVRSPVLCQAYSLYQGQGAIAKIAPAIGHAWIRYEKQR